ncbi:predicted protein, partial [Nematostella vectensis]
VSPVGIENKWFYLAVVVNADPRKPENRKAIRGSWGLPNLQRGYIASNQDKLEWKVFFAMGKTGDNSQDSRNIREAEEQNDLLIGNFNDTYNNLVVKTFMSHLWTLRLKCKYVLKTDEDVYIRLPVLISWLRSQGSPARFYGGHVYEGYRAIRDPCSSKWAISKAYFPDYYFPPFCGGAFHVISSDVVPDIVWYTSQRPPFHLDDAYIGVVARDLRIQAVNIPGFN